MRESANLVTATEYGESGGVLSLPATRNVVIDADDAVTAPDGLICVATQTSRVSRIVVAAADNSVIVSGNAVTASEKTSSRAGNA